MIAQAFQSVRFPILPDVKHIKERKGSDHACKEKRLLVTQMAATHVALIRAARPQVDAEYAETVNVCSNSYNRLARTFTAQAEQLRRHRTGGQSKVVAEHVTVNDGGQAIVAMWRGWGNVES